MVPYPPLPRVAAHGSTLLRLPALRSAVRASALLAAALVGATLSVSAWALAGVGAVGLVAAGLATRHLRTLRRELRDVQRARAEWERRYGRLYDSVAVGVFRADPQGRFTGANRGLCALLGYRSEAELLAANFAQEAYVGPGTFEAVLQRARAHGAVENLELRLRRFDGLTVTALATIQAIWDDAGEVTAFEGTVVDSTRERLAESQRRSMERRFRRLFDSSAVGMLVGNLRRGTLEEANPSLMELFGLRPSELPVPFAKVIPPDQRALHRNMRAALEADGFAGPLAAEYLRADGARVPVLLSAGMVEPRHGEFVAVLVDRTAETNAAHRAAQPQAFHAMMLEEVPIPVATFDGDRRLAHANSALRALLGVPGQQHGDGLADLLGRGCPAAVAEAVERAIRGEAVRLALDRECGGSRQRLDLTLVPRCRENATPAGFLAVIQHRSGPAHPRTGAPVVTPVTGCDGGGCLEARRTA
jgi:PAS domain S-box-containing protein